MHLIMIGIQLILMLSVLSNFNRLPYVLGGFYLLGVLSSVFGIDVSFVTIAGITLGASDILTMIFLIYLLRKPYIKKNAVNMYLLAYLAILFFAFLSAFVDRNVSAIIANIRKYFEYAIPWLVMLNFSENMYIDAKKMKRYFDTVFAITVLVCFVGFAMYVAGISSTPRVIGSDNTMILSCYFLYRVYDEIYSCGQAFMSIGSLVILVTIILLQHNSVWVATAIGLSIIILFTISKRGIGAIPGMIFLMFLLFVGYIYITQYSTGVIAEYMRFSFSKFDDMDTGTIGHRKERWDTMLKSLSGYEYLVGQSFSVPTVAGDGTTFSAHNAYVAAIMHSGILGLLCFVGALLASLLRCLKMKNILFFSIIASVVVYWYAYEPNLNFGVMFGMLYVFSDKLILNTVLYKE